MAQLPRPFRTLSASLLVLACGGGDGDGDSSASSVDTGLAEARLLSDLTTTEAVSACDKVQAIFDTRLNEADFYQSLCQTVGAAFTTNEADCQQLASTCLDELTSGQQGQFSDVTNVDFECEEYNGDFESCSSTTVGQLESCFNDQLDMMATLLGGLTCADAGSEAGEELRVSLGDEDRALPASCQVAAMDCPDLFGDD